MVLTSVDRKELHSAILEYIKLNASSTSVLSLLQQLEQTLNTISETKQQTVATATASVVDQQESLLEKRWGLLKRLTYSNTQLEDKVKRLEKELELFKNPLTAGRQNNNNNNLENKNNQQSSPLLLPSGPAPPLLSFTGHRDTITAIAVHPLDPIIISASLDGTVRVWDTSSSSANQQQQQMIKKQAQKFSHSENINCLSIEPLSGDYFVVGTNSSSSSNSNNSGTAGGDLLWNNDENRSGDGNVFVYQMMENCTNNENNNRNLFSRDEETILLGVGSAMNRYQYSCVRSLNHSSSKRKRSNTTGDQRGGVSDTVSCVCWVRRKEQDAQNVTTNNNKLFYLVSCSQDSGSICVWDPYRGSLKHEIYINDESKITSCCGSFHQYYSSFVAVGCRDQTLALIDLSSSSSMKHDGNNNNDQNDNDDDSLVVCKNTSIHTNAVTAVTFLDQLLHCESALVEKYGNPERRAERRAWMSTSNNINHTSRNNNTHVQFLISCGRDKNVVLSDIVLNASKTSISSSNKYNNKYALIPLWSFEGHGGWVNSLCLFPQQNTNTTTSLQGVYLATCSDDETIRILDVTSSSPTTKEVRRIDLNSGGGGCLCLGAAPPAVSSKLLLCSGGTDRTVSVWGFKG